MEFFWLFDVVVVVFTLELKFLNLNPDSAYCVCGNRTLVGTFGIKIECPPSFRR